MPNSTEPEDPGGTGHHPPEDAMTSTIRLLLGPPEANPPAPGTFAAALADRFRTIAQDQKRRNVLDFVRSAAADQLQPKDTAAFLCDLPRTGRVSSELRRSLQHLLQQETLPRRLMPDLVQQLQTAVATAAHSIRNQDPPEHQATAALKLAQRHTRKIILQKSPDHPAPPVPTADPDLATSFQDALEARLTAQADPDQWHELIALLSATGRALADYPATQRLPPWFRTDTMVVTQENRQLGHNWLHPNPIDLTAPPQANSHYLQEVLNNARASGLSVPDTARLLLKPYLNAQAAARLPEHEPEDFYYTDDGPINYHEPTDRRFLQGDIADPDNHQSTTYCRNIREAMMNRGLAADIETNRPDLLALSLPRNALALQRLDRFQQNLYDQLADRQDAAATAPALPVHWRQGNARAWQAVRQATDNLSREGPLADSIKSAIDATITRHTASDLIDPDEPSRNYNFIPRLEPEPTTDVDHPSRLLLREALKDLYHALEALDQIQQERQRAPEHRLLRQQIAQANLARFNQEGRSASFIEAAQHYLENDYVHQPGEPDTQSIYQNLRNRTKGELTESGLPPAQAEQVTANHRITALYDRVMRSLAHADFNLSAVAVSQTKE